MTLGSMAPVMAEAPIFEALANETRGQTMGLPVYRYPEVRTLRARLRYEERVRRGIVRAPRPTLADTLGRMYTVNRHSDDL